MSTATAKAKEIAKNPMKLMPDEPLALPSAHKVKLTTLHEPPV